MLRCARLAALVVVVLPVLLAGVACKREASSGSGPAATAEPAAKVQKALRRAQARAVRRPRDLQAQLAAGKISYDNGLYNDAFRAYQQAATIDPENFEAILGMARTNLKLLNPTQGLDWVERARQVKPQDVELLDMQARMYLLAGKMDQAIGAFRQSTKLAPGRTTSWLNLASAYAITRQYPNAVAAARQATQISPDSAAAHFVLGRYCEKNGDLGTAEREYRTALKLDTNHVAARISLGELLMKDKRKLDEARQLLVKASQLQEDRPDAPVLAAWVLHLQGENRDAADELVKVVNTTPQNADAWAKLAVVLRKLGSRDQAKRAETMAKQFLSQPHSMEMEMLQGR